ncbi:MAG: endopeptidase La [Tissierellia bacterium]|nr:endopeptidase La [Tissierellia bacterium]
MADYKKIKKKYPLIPLRGISMFPHMVVHFDIGRDASIKALEEAELRDGLVMLASQKDPKIEEPEPDDIYTVGTVAKIRQLIKIPGGNIRALVEGVSRAQIKDFISTSPIMEVEVGEIKYSEKETDKKTEAAMRLIMDDFEEILSFSDKQAPEIVSTLIDLKDPGQLADIIASYSLSKMEDVQEVIAELDQYKRLELVHIKLQQEIEIMQIEAKIDKRLKSQINKVQKEYYLREQMRAIQKELGDDDGFESEILEYEEKLKSRDLPEEVVESFKKELERLSYQSDSAPEASVIRTYLDTILELPWDIETEDKIDVKYAREILNEDHYGLEDVKERILEHIALRKFSDKTNGAIICLVGPPGVGKTSIAKSIARAMNKNFTRVSLGGVSDEAEIRGHRRTYIGAMPGNIINGLKKAKSRNPVFLLDEIDKLGRDYKGDPSSALLEALDPEQNVEFTDHYLDLAFDLSKVMFITTANTTSTIPAPLYDRMEVIQVSGYTAEEKFNIAKDHLIPKALESAGLNKSSVKFTDATIRNLIDYYTREAGVRNLEREIKTLIRKSVKKIVEDDLKSVSVTIKLLEDMIGAPRYRFDKMSRKNRVGISTGLAWTRVGGETLTVEVNIMDGTGKIQLTGKLGDVMKESAMAAISYIRSKSSKFKLPKDFYKEKDIHIHVPEGAIPKDGPSAGITIATAVISALTKIPVRRDVAMTGEVTIRGDVLPIGGLKEKVLAAKRMGIKELIIPEENRKDYDELKDNVKEDLIVNFVKHMDEVLKISLQGEI